MQRVEVGEPVDADKRRRRPGSRSFGSRHPLREGAPLLGNKRTPGERVENDAIDPNATYAAQKIPIPLNRSMN
jgi:hypothetical protein